MCGNDIDLSIESISVQQDRLRKSNFDSAMLFQNCTEFLSKGILLYSRGEFNMLIFEPASSYKSTTHVFVIRDLIEIGLRFVH